MGIWENKSISLRESTHPNKLIAFFQCLCFFAFLCGHICMSLWPFSLFAQFCITSSCSRVVGAATWSAPPAYWTLLPAELADKQELMSLPTDPTPHPSPPHPPRHL